MAGDGARVFGDVLVVDVGNTETCLGLFRNGTLAGRFALTTPERLTPDEAQLSARQVLAVLGHAADAPHGAILSSVVPILTDAWVTALRSVSETCPLVVGPGLKTGIRMRYDDPAEVGSDRLADVVAARETYGAPVIAVDLGTTTNIEVVDGEGTFLGGVIAPGLRLGARALSQAAARLPAIELRAPEHVIGRSTRGAMRSGVVCGEVARLDGLLDMVMSEMGCVAPIVMTGDDVQFVAPLLSHPVQVDTTLTLRGLYLLWARNARS